VHGDGGSIGGGEQATHGLGNLDEPSYSMKIQELENEEKYI